MHKSFCERESNVRETFSVILAGYANCGEGMTCWKFSDRKSVRSLCVFCVLSTEDRSPKMKVLLAKYSSLRASISLAGDVEKCQYTGSPGPTDSRGATIQNVLNSDSRSLSLRKWSFVLATNAKYFRFSLSLLLAPIGTRGWMINNASCEPRVKRERRSKIELIVGDQSATYRRIVNKDSVLISRCERVHSAQITLVYWLTNTNGYLNFILPLISFMW